MRQAFTALGVETPEQFQLDVAARIQAGNLVLVSPTGSGKTAMAIAPFLHASRHRLPFADRLIYATPVRTLLNAARATLEDHLRAKGDVMVTTQSGDRHEDPYFKAPITFTTIDQILSSFLLHPVSLPGAQRNIPAGALVGAYLVIDEFHLLPPATALSVVAVMARRLGPLTRVLLMSATCPTSLARHLAQVIGGTSHVITHDEANVTFRVGRHRTLRMADQPLGVEAVATTHKRGQRTLIVCNTVGRAQALFAEIQDHTDLKHERCRLLHSRFLASDRRHNEQHLLGAFGKDADAPESGLVIATQVVEVGLDLSFPRLLTEACPAASLVQRIGRCARRAGESGEAIVYPVDGPHGTRPYTHTEVTAATSRLIEMGARGEPILWDEGVEADFINRVDGGAALSAFEAIVADPNVILADMAGEDRSIVRTWVRDVQSHTVNLVDADTPLPGVEDLRRGPRTLAVSDTSLRGFLGTLDLQGADADGVRWAEILAADTGGVGAEETERAPFAARWHPFTHVDDLFRAEAVALTPAYAGYDPRRGLLLGKNCVREFRQVEQSDTSPPCSRDQYAAVAETWLEHASNTLDAWRSAVPTNSVGLQLVATALGVDSEALSRFLELIPLLHDAGKLSARWQDGIWARERRASNPPRDGFLAHSSNRDGRGFRPLPHHAAQGAYWLVPVIYAAALRVGSEATAEGTARTQQIIAAAAIGAVARHHSASTKTVARDLPLAAGGAAEIARVTATCAPSNALLPPLQEIIQDSRIKRFIAALPEPISPRDCWLMWPVYLYLVRRLRLADWGSFQIHRNGSPSSLSWSAPGR